MEHFKTMILARRSIKNIMVHVSDGFFMVANKSSFKTALSIKINDRVLAVLQFISYQVNFIKFVIGSPL